MLCSCMGDNERDNTRIYSLRQFDEIHFATSNQFEQIDGQIAYYHQLDSLNQGNEFYIYANLGELYMERRLSKSALPYLIIADSIQSGNDTIKYHMGFCYWINQDTIKAKYTLSSSSGNYLPSTSLLAEIYFGQDSLHKAKELFEKVVKMDSVNLKALYFLGRTYRFLGSYEASLKVLNKLTDVEPKWALGIHAKGLTLAQMGRYKEAETELLTAYELSGNSTSFLYDLYQLYVEIENYPQACIWLQQMINAETYTPSQTDLERCPT